MADDLDYGLEIPSLSPPMQPLDHGAWAMKDRYGRGWIGCFSVKVGCIEHVRDDHGMIRLFGEKDEALRAALWAHIDRQNAPRRPLEGKKHAVLGSGRNRHLRPWGARHGS